MGEGTQQDYVVLARKYRPKSFAELYGQDALVRTLSNAIAANKIHHAYVLTGIRGVGKTTTARIIAKALNCANGPSINWEENDPQVQAITAGTHMDVLEYDAASNRGVDEVAKLFEGIAYAPVAGRYKVYIIDEVHMLSSHAFNAILKTLEEPPPRVKFIFATTEVNKIPITVLSRCQRFDLKRIPSETLVRLFTGILEKEGIQAEPAAVAMVARAADGSARDGLSLLDQAIALSHGQAVVTALVQEMLGLADRTQLYDLLERVLGGQVAEALSLLDGLYARGQDALGVVQGLLEMVHLLTRLKIVPGLKDEATISEIEKTRAVPLAEKIGKAGLGRLYQLLLQAGQEVKQAERPYEALSMAMVRMAYLAPLPAMDKLMSSASAVLEGGSAPLPAAVQAAPVVATVQKVEARVETVTQVVSAVPTSAKAPVGVTASAVPPWEEPVAAMVSVSAAVVDAGPVTGAVVAEVQQVQIRDWGGLVAEVKRLKPALAASLARQVRCVNIRPEQAEPEATIVVDKGLHEAKDLIRDLRVVLKDVTGQTWQIIQELGALPTGAMTLVEKAKEEVEEQKRVAAEDPLLKDVLAMFPGAEIEDIQSTEGA